MMFRNSIGRTLLAGCLLGVGLLKADAQSSRAYLLMNDGKKKPALGILIDPSTGDAILSLPNNQRMNVPKSSYKRAYGSRPKEWAQILGAIKAKKFKEVIPVLDNVIRKNRALYWDLEALALKGRAEVELGLMKEAVATLDKLVRAPYGSDLIKGPVFESYLTALKDSNNPARLKQILSKTIQNGARADAAIAYIIKGDMRLDEGDSEGAVLHYLKPALLFTQQAEQCAQANYKAGDVLEKMRDARAQERFKTAAQLSPDTKWGRLAKSRIK
ncbi:MAG: hypothetical protein AAF492_11565 [Verrucomicrobiota bacterium]